jgi:hypothetical protein
MPKKFSLPSEIYLYREQDSDGGSYLLTTESIFEAVETAGDEDTIIGTYKLVEEGKYGIVKTLVDL